MRRHGLVRGGSHGPGWGEARSGLAEGTGSLRRSFFHRPSPFHDPHREPAPVHRHANIYHSLAGPLRTKIETCRPGKDIGIRESRMAVLHKAQIFLLLYFQANPDVPGRKKIRNYRILFFKNRLVLLFPSAAL